MWSCQTNVPLHGMSGESRHRGEERSWHCVSLCFMLRSLVFIIRSSPPPPVSLSDMATLLRCRAQRQIKVGIYYIKCTCCDLMCPAMACTGNVTASPRCLWKSAGSGSAGRNIVQAASGWYQEGPRPFEVVWHEKCIQAFFIYTPLLWSLFHHPPGLDEEFHSP